MKYLDLTHEILLAQIVSIDITAVHRVKEQQYNHAAKTVDELFHWSDTNEGREYWLNIAEKIRDVYGVPLYWHQWGHLKFADHFERKVTKEYADKGAI